MPGLSRASTISCSAGQIVDGLVKPGHDAGSVVVEFVPVGSIPLGSARTHHAPPILNYPQFSISPFEKLKRTHHNLRKRPALKALPRGRPCQRS